jgi:outer membrane murein-binding lipoprotein Lpp
VTRLLLLTAALTATAACASRPSVDVVAADTHRLGLAVERLQAHQDSVRTEVQAAREARSREIAGLRERLDALQADLTDLRSAVDRLAQAQAEPVAAQEPAVSPPTQPAGRPTAGRVSVGPTTSPTQP